MNARPLEGISVVEFQAIGPVPFACAHLADLGASITRIARPGGRGSNLPAAFDATSASVGSIVELDLKSASGTREALALIDAADVVIEGFRPGTMERLGLGPEVVMGRNPTVVYARVTGWGQTGPYATMAGHDINYIGLAGALHAIGTGEIPIPPLNLIGDYGGGAMFAISGILAGLVNRNSSGSGAVVDIAMVDGAAALLAPIRAMLDGRVWRDRRAANLLDGGAPFYRVYRTADERFVAVGALEPAFYTDLLTGLDLAEDDLPNRYDPEAWQELTELFAARFATRTRAEWSDVFDGTDACVTPVLAMSEVMEHPHNSERDALIQDVVGTRPAVAPRFIVS